MQLHALTPQVLLDLAAVRPSVSVNYPFSSIKLTLVCFGPDGRANISEICDGNKLGLCLNSDKDCIFRPLDSSKISEAEHWIKRVAIGLERLEPVAYSIRNSREDAIDLLDRLSRTTTNPPDTRAATTPLDNTVRVPAAAGWRAVHILARDVFG